MIKQEKKKGKKTVIKGRMEEEWKVEKEGKWGQGL